MGGRMHQLNVTSPDLCPGCVGGVVGGTLPQLDVLNFQVLFPRYRFAFRVRFTLDLQTIDVDNSSTTLFTAFLALASYSCMLLGT